MKNDVTRGIGVCESLRVAPFFVVTPAEAGGQASFDVVLDSCRRRNDRVRARQRTSHRTGRMRKNVAWGRGLGLQSVLEKGTEVCNASSDG